MTIWFTGDQHFGHINIIKYANRPFASIEEHDAMIIERHNEVVGPDDVVYNLGDVCLGRGKEAQHYFSQLNGQIQVLGYPWHHDKRWLPKLFASISQVHFGESPYSSKGGIYAVEILLPMVILEFKEFSKTKFPKAIVLCHYQIARWDRRHYNSWHLFGHSHGKVSGEGLSFDVGVDCWDFAPVPLYKVAEIMKERENENHSR